MELFTYLKKKFLLAVGFCLFLNPSAIAQEAHIIVDASKVVNRISPLIYGSCIEDVNHEIYGGLYDQKIFGESFEEPSLGMEFEGFTSYDGLWGMNGTGITVDGNPGAKIISELSDFADGSVEVDVKFTAIFGDNAGLIIRAANLGKGADNFDGYEISLSHNGKKIILGKHRHDWKALQESEVKFNRNEWNHLRVEMKGPGFRIFLNRKVTPVIDYIDNDAPLLTGKVG